MRVKRTTGDPDRVGKKPENTTKTQAKPDSEVRFSSVLVVPFLEIRTCARIPISVM